MWSLLTRGGAVAGSALLSLRRAAAVIMTIAMITGTAALGTTVVALTGMGSEAGTGIESDRGVGDRSDVKMIRDLQLPTL